MTTPNVRCTCCGTAHPSADQLASERRIALLRFAFYTLGAKACAVDTGRMHGPREYPAPFFTERMRAATDHIGRGTRDD